MGDKKVGLHGFQTGGFHRNPKSRSLWRDAISGIDHFHASCVTDSWAEVDGVRLKVLGSVVDSIAAVGDDHNREMDEAGTNEGAWKEVYEILDEPLALLEHSKIYNGDDEAAFRAILEAMTMGREQTQHPLDNFEEIYRTLWHELRRRYTEGLDFKSHTEEELAFLLTLFLQQKQRIMRTLAFAQTHEGCLALVPGDARREDVIAVIHGCSVPFLIRNSGQTQLFSVVGACYVGGIMEGDVFDSHDAPCAAMITLI
jgi:hypothetical protein